MYRLSITVLLLCICFSAPCQNNSLPEKLDEVLITSTRIDIPFSENSRTITVITSQDIALSGVTNLTDLLQQYSGVDIRRKGIVGMQSDLYIRGGSFDQTLLLIDGIKVEDAQTGHHTMNMALPLEVIERIEIIKGPAARIFGQNAFSGAINIVTKKSTENVNSIGYQLGSFDQENVVATFGKDFDSGFALAHASVNTSDGYRYNTDFKNQNYFIKGSLNQKSSPIDILGYYSSRDFGANGFYASPAAIDQYEETQTSLVGVSSEYKLGSFNIKPRLYWRRNQDMFLFVRQDPSVYRNLHITNKIGAEVNSSLESKLGTTGLGIDLAKVYLRSNNLGDRERDMINIFLEHKFSIANDKIDLTPGIAVNYFSDFKFHAFPGMDIGYSLNKNLKLYGNIGYTYRIPTYTDLFYSDPSTLGNENLDPEEAFAQELGMKYFGNKINASIAFFNRNSDNLIDYVKENEDDLWQATNIRNLNTSGIEANMSFRFNLFSYDQKLQIGYTFIDDDVKDLNLNFSRYSINSLKHQFNSTLFTRLSKNLYNSLAINFSDRTLGESYTVVDTSVTLRVNGLELSAIANNIFNAAYSETNLVPMPKGHVIIGALYRFN